METAPGQLEVRMRGALNAGVTREKLVEIVFHMSVYAGVPACVNALNAAKIALEAVDSNVTPAAH